VKLQPERLLQGTEDVKSIPVDSASIVSLQDEKHVGFKSMVDDILQVAERHLAKLNQRQRETCPASELVVGMQCGGSDAFSGVTANPAVGYASDLLVRCGATVMFSEVTEVRDAIHLLTRGRLTKRSVNACWKRWPGTITISIWAKPTAAPTPPRQQERRPGQRGGKSAGFYCQIRKSAIVEVLSPGSARPNAA
jgi:galactarate dehydratase